MAALFVVVLAFTFGPPAAQAETTDAATLVGRMELPDGGTLGGFDQSLQDVAKNALEHSPAPTKWSLSESANAPTARLRAPEGTASGGDVTIMTDTSAAADTRDLYTWEECEQHDPHAQRVNAVLKNHYALCIVARGRYTFEECVEGRCTVVGWYAWRLTVLGEGTRGTQTMYLTGRFDQWVPVNKVNPGGTLSAGFDCLNLGNSVCRSDHPSGRTDTLIDWMLNGYFGDTFDTTGSPAADDRIHYAADKVNYHELSIWTDSPDMPGGSFQYAFRCDAAEYVNGGACIYHDIDAKIRYPLTGGGVDDVAAHIKKAQDDPEHTYPGGVGTVIPGKPGDKPLTRLYPKMDDESGKYYEQNNTIAKDTCFRYEPIEYALDPTKQCDEYPFRSTWEGANFTRWYPNAAWKYSAKMVNGKQNGLAGSQLGGWYKRDNILAKDKFWVEITDSGGGAGTDPDDTPPQVDAGPDVQGPEGSAIALRGSASDRENQALPVRWSYRAVSGVDPGATCTFADSAQEVTTITCNDDGVFEVTLTADDGVNAPVSDSATLTVTNVAPQFGGPRPQAVTTSSAATKVAAATAAEGDLAPPPWTLYRVGTAVTLSTPFDDPGSNDTQQCVVDWDDGTPPQAYAAHDRTCDATHTYRRAGMFTITLTNTDDDTGADTWTTMVVVYDPDAGGANADGAFTSVAGLWTTDPTAAGEQWWHLTARYHKPNDTKPVGAARAWLPGTNLRFDTRNDTGVDWLVVTPDGKIASKGHGTLAGRSGEYGYVYYGYDGCANGQTPGCVPGPDRFRTVLWPLSQGTYPTPANVTYDNRPSAGYDVDVATPQQLTSGIVTIHRPS
ncbi:hypothetical protein [Amycolatopsis sp. DG1A-15b]|uniref:NucA/NucB deoxyribonuclease domain-containing protein n=1 Tax=Amycolatopsis sp. DG1A-15b TaxID=3052846 RepID=UPI00255C112F|nr:hypothetical protein [Amycolatopsis sp. DG1A-15b]WIX85695.1 hypothetical protein QRY02_31345 [Amycolatopsis sp. DG1A-15b]